MFAYTLIIFLYYDPPIPTYEEHIINFKSLKACETRAREIDANLSPAVKHVKMMCVEQRP